MHSWWRRGINHLHLVLYIDLETVNAWSDREVVEQWHNLMLRCSRP
ncbi:hypothetical protein Shal_2412 [Shewanella halifaxensis HAW-EB4]|uniref:Transposase n=1 Tax=Shewanella halifaxensis (strain HAW-EB4) TaxID=458817 RepID=B0TJH4_SHEHH|nr:hypothetical protein Shal_2412 [Shewanella halifaxensis HAW-EB4]